MGSICQLYAYIRPIPPDEEGPFDETTAIIYNYDNERGSDWIVAPFKDDVKICRGIMQLSVKDEENCSNCVFTARDANNYDIPSLTELRMEVNKVFYSPVCIKAFKIMCD